MLISSVSLNMANIVISIIGLIAIIYLISISKSNKSYYHLKDNFSFRSTNERSDEITRISFDEFLTKFIPANDSIKTLFSDHFEIILHDPSLGDFNKYIYFKSKIDSDMYWEYISKTYPDIIKLIKE